MELEITIKVPVGGPDAAAAQPSAATVSVSPPVTPAAEDWLGAPSGANGEAASDGSGPGSPPGPPSLGELGIEVRHLEDEAAPPSLRTVERLAAEAEPVSPVPPGLEDPRVAAMGLGDPVAPSGPPDLPDPSQVPDVGQGPPPPAVDVAP